MLRVRAELTRVVYAVQQFDGASADHAASVNQKTRRERRQGEERELLQIQSNGVIHWTPIHTVITQLLILGYF